MNQVAVSEKIFNWAIERSQLSLTGLEKKFPKLRHWISGDLHPTLKQLESLAKVTLTPLGYFFLKEPPEERLPFPIFRTFDDDVTPTPSPELLETVHTMQRRQVWMRDYLIEQENGKLGFVSSAKSGDEIHDVADQMRNALNFEPDWASSEKTWSDSLKTLRNAMEEIGILISVSGIVDNNTHRKLDPDEFKGFVLVDDVAPLVFINGVDWKASQMFTLAHELAHIFLGSSAAFDLRNMLPAKDPTEKACNQIAAEFLVPESKLKEFWRTAKSTIKPYQSVARQFKVSEIVGARRALDIGLINKSKFLDFYSSYQNRELKAFRKKPKGGNFYATQNLRLGRRFSTTVIRATREGKLLYSEAFRLTNLYGKTFEKFASKLGMGES